MLGEVGEAARQNGGLVTQTLEFGEQGFSAFSQTQRGADRVQYADIQTFEQGQALFEAGAEVQLSSHRPLSDFRNLVAHTSGLGQLVDHFGFDQR
ncbi:hypothetical protein D3C71_1829980 [compost metagenome]